MSASSVQQTMEETDTVKELKPTKPPIKPKPVVPPRPKQAFASPTNSEIKSPLLSPSSGAPWSPTSDIPSAFKISQLTGPQPYGTRRTSLKRWSSSVGEDASPDGNVVLSPVDNSFADVSAKVTPPLSSVPTKPFQTGSVWKGKSPFMLTTRGWGEHKGSQGKDSGESQSAFQKQGFGLSQVSKDREGVPLELNAVNKSTNSSTIKLTTDGDGDHANVQNLNLSLANNSDKVETNSSVTGNSKTLLSQSDKIQKSQEGSPLSVSSQSGLYFGTAKQSTHYDLNQDVKKEVTAYNSNLEVTQKPSIPPEVKDIKKVSGISTSTPEKVNRENESPPVTIPPDQQTQTGVISEEHSQNLHGGLKHVENGSLRTKKPIIISPVLTSTEKASYLDTENSEKAQAKTEESPSYVPPEPKIQEFQRYHKHGSDLKPDPVPLTREEVTVSEYLQTSQSLASEPNQNKDQVILEKPTRAEDADSSLITHLTDNKLTGYERYKEIHHEDKENINPAEHVLVSSAHHKPAVGKAYGTESTSNINEPYSSDHEDETCPAAGIQSPGYTVKFGHSSEGHQDPGTQIHDYYAEVEEREPHDNRQQEYEAAMRREKYRSHHENNAQSSYDSEAPSASELPGPADNQTSPHLYMRSEMLHSDKPVPREVYTHSDDESKQPTHSYIEKETPRVTQIQPEILSQQEDYKSSRPDPNYSESQFMYSKSASQDPAKRVNQPEDVSDNWKQTGGLQYYSAGSPRLKDHEASLDKLKYKAEETAEPQYTHNHSEPQEHSYVYKEELGEEHEPVHHKYGHSEELVYSDLLLQESVHKKEQSGLPSHMYELSNEPVQTHTKSDEGVYEYEQQEQSCKNVQSEEIDHKYHQLEETGQKYQPPKHETLEAAVCGYGQSKETVHRDDQTDEPVYKYKDSIEPVHDYVQSEESVQRYQKPEVSDHKHEQAGQQDPRSDESSKPDHKYDVYKNYGQSEEPDHKYEQSEEPYNRIGYSKGTVYTYEQSEKPDQKYEQSKESYNRNIQSAYTYEESDESDHKNDQPEKPYHKYEQSEQPYNRNAHSVYTYEESDESDHKYEQPEEPYHKYGQSEEPSHKYEQPEEPGHKYGQSAEPSHKYGQSEEPGHKYEQPEEPGHKYGQSEEPGHQYEQPEEPGHQYEQSEDPYNTNIHSVYTYRQSEESDHRDELLEEPGHKYGQLEESHHKYGQLEESHHKYGQLEESHQTYGQSEDPRNINIHSVYTYEQPEERSHKYEQPEQPSHKYEQPEEPGHKYEQPEEPGHKYGHAEEPDHKYGLAEEPGYKYGLAEEPGYKYGLAEEPGHKYGLAEEQDHKYGLAEEPGHKYGHAEESDHKYGQAEESDHKYGQAEEPDHKYGLAEEPSHKYVHAEEPYHKYGHAEEPSPKYRQAEEPGHTYGQAEEPDHKYGLAEEPSHIYGQAEEPGHKYGLAEEPGHKDGLAEEPDHKYGLAEEPGHKHGLAEEPGHKYGLAEESDHKFEQPEKTDDKPKQSEEFISTYQQVDETTHRKNDKEDPGQRYEPSDNLTHSPQQVQLHKQPAEPAYMHIQSGNKESKHAQPAHADLELLADQYKHYQSEKADITPHISQKPYDISAQSFEPVSEPEQHSEKHPRDSHTEEPKYGDTSPHEINYKVKDLEEQDQKYSQSEGPLRQSAQKEATHYLITDTKESHHVDGLPGEPRRKIQDETLESDGSMPQVTQNEEDKHSHDKILNGHAEQDLQTVYSTAEKQAEEPEETQTEETPTENFDFLEGTTVLDTGFMRSRASLGKKRGHRTPATGPGASNEEDDPEYWMFRDSTEPKINQRQNSEQEERVETSPDVSPDTTPSPGKAPKKGLFGGIISPSLLKGRLKTRSKTTEDEPMKRSPDSEEPKSPKEKPESTSHSLNWLQALKKKKKKQPK